MNQKKLNVLFYLNKAKTNQKGVCPIYCRLTYLKKRAQFSTGEFINPLHWNSKKQKAVSITIESEQLNLQLQIISAGIQKEYLKLQLKGIEFNVRDIMNSYIGEPIQQEINVIAYYKGFLLKRKRLIGIDLKLATWKKFNYTCAHLHDFIKWKFNKLDYPFKELKAQFLNDFEYYLKTEKHHKQITINKTIQRLRKGIREAVAEGILAKDPFSSHKPGRVLKSVIFLSVEELNLLENHTFAQPRLELVRDLFIFCCYTGLAYNEMFNLMKTNVIKGFDGKLWINMKRAKTSKEISIPLLPKALEIMEKYESDKSGHVLPRFSNQKINSYLKEIDEITGIDKGITHHTARKTFASTVLLFNGVPMEVVSELLGHSNMKITQDYYGKVVQKSVSIEICKLSERLE